MVDREEQVIGPEDQGSIPGFGIMNAPGETVLPWQAPAGEIAFVSTMPSPKESLIAVNDTLQLSELLGKGPIKVRHVTVHMVTLTGEDGQQSIARRTVLTDTKGVNYACVSDGVIGSLQQLAAVFGDPPWEEGLAVKVIQNNTRHGFRVYRLIPA